MSSESEVSGLPGVPEALSRTLSPGVSAGGVHWLDGVVAGAGAGAEALGADSGWALEGAGVLAKGSGWGLALTPGSSVMVRSLERRSLAGHGQDQTEEGYGQALHGVPPGKRFQPFSPDVGRMQHGQAWGRYLASLITRVSPVFSITGLEELFTMGRERSSTRRSLSGCRPTR